MAQNIGVRTTNQAITEERVVRSVFPDISLLDPDETPLVTLLNRINGRKSPVDNTKFEWLEDDYCARWASIGATTIAATSVLVTVVDGTLFIPGDLAIVPKAVTSSAAPEMFRVTLVTGNILTVVRDVGGGGAATIEPGDALRIVGSAFEENSAFPSVKTTSPVTRFNYTQIIRTATNFSGTMEASKVYGAAGGDRKREHRKKLIEHKEKINSALIWGQRSQALTGGPTGNPIRTTNGINAVISTNVLDMTGILTRKKLDQFFRMGFRYGRKKKILLCAPIIQSAINEWAINFLNVAPSETKWGMSITKIETPYGIAAMVKDWMLESGVSGKNGFANWGFLLDMDEIRYRHLAGNGENRDTRIEMDSVKDGTDGKRDEILTEVGFEIKQEKFHAKMFNVTDWMQ
jgi:hypothetical protein